MKRINMLQVAVVLSVIALIVSIKRGVMLNIVLASVGCTIFLALFVLTYFRRKKGAQANNKK